MTNTHLWNIDDLIKHLEGLKKKRNVNYVVFNIGSMINATVPSKKLPYYKIGFSMAKDIFEKEDIGPIAHSEHILPFSGFFVQKQNEKLLNKELLKKKKELEKAKNEKHP